jgi:alpha,alpha-trehalase
VIRAQIILSAFCIFATCVQAQSKPDIQTYISDAWITLTRNVLSCQALVDPKMPAGRSVLYYPADVQPDAHAKQIAAKCGVQISQLPFTITKPGEADLSKLKQHGLLYLPNPYVVPGGRFNEMYGWDSYFIILGLLESGHKDLARGMVENFFFELEHYGAILNANRTYYLTRSQPPFLTSMILAVCDADPTHTCKNKEWLQRAYAAAKKDHDNWTSPAHLAGNTGLSRYYDYGNGPVPEEAQGNYEYYRKTGAALLKRPDGQQFFRPATPLDSPITFDALKLGRATTKTNRLAFTSEFYKGDRAMRESGFDVSFRFGPYSAETHHFAPVCLNSLLYKAEWDLAELARRLGDKRAFGIWRVEAQRRWAEMDKYFWDARRGLFFDYDFTRRRRSDYVFATTFYPLWAGLATKQQAAAIVRNLPTFEKPGGIVMSTHETGAQWDAPYGWAPIQLLAVEGLRRYHYDDDADRLSKKWLSMIVENYQHEGTIREKYNVVTQSSDVKISIGYQANVLGFGWTNGAFLELLHELPKEEQKSILEGEPATVLGYTNSELEPAASAADD